jgi:hypothetical protein
MNKLDTGLLLIVGAVCLTLLAKLYSSLADSHVAVQLGAIGMAFFSSGRGIWCLIQWARQEERISR